MSSGALGEVECPQSQPCVLKSEADSGWRGHPSSREQMPGDQGKEVGLGGRGLQP